MWKSMIYESPEPEIEWHKLNPQWLRWLDTVTEEPWFVALEDLVKWSGTWTGTEEELVEEVSLRVSREVRESEDFPSTYEKFSEYYDILYYSDPHRPPMILDYRELTKKDLEEFDVPGWGPEAPILVERDFAGRKPRYRAALCDLLYRYRSPLSIAVLNFTYSSSKFTKKNRVWSGFTNKLAEQLRGYCPIPSCSGQFPTLPPIPDDPEGEDLKRRFDETYELLDLMEFSDYRELAGRMRTCAYILKEFGVKVSWEKVSVPVSDSEGRPREKQKLYWTVEAPRWRN